MNASQKQQVITQIETYFGIDLNKIFVDKFGVDANPNETPASDYSVMDIMILSQKMISQLSERINTIGVWQFMPAFHNFNNDFGNCELPGNLSALNTYLTRGDFTNAEAQLKTLIYYQIANGFWDRPKKIELGVRMENLDKLEEKVNLLSTHIDKQSNDIREQIKGIDSIKNELETLVETKTSEFNTITDNVISSTEYLEKIIETESEVQTIHKSISTTDTNCTTIKEAIDTLHKNSQATQEKIDEKLSEAETKLTEISTDHQFVEEKKEQVREMMGYIADGTLSHSFNSRKKKIQKSVWLWLGISIGSAILMGVWIYIVFTQLSAGTENVFANMFINVAKTTPMIALFWFSLNQYQKERNLLEEYAFREAMAVTLTAYLDQLHGETDKNKQNMLIGTVEKLYTQPKISKEGIGLFSFKSKDLVELVKEVKEILLEVKSGK